MMRRRNGRVFIIVQAVVLTLVLLITAVPVSATENTVTFDPQGGKGMEFTTKEVALGEAYGALPTPYRPGYLFDGWFDAPESNGNGTFILPGSIRSTSDSAILFARWEPSPKQKNTPYYRFEIAKWNVKKKLTVKLDLNHAAELTGLTETKKNKHSFQKWGMTLTRLYDKANNGSVSINMKIGTLTLRKASPADLVVSTTNKNNTYNGHYSNNARSESTSGRCWIVFYKGSKTADVYSQYYVQVHKPGKTVKIDGVDVTLAKTHSFKRGKTYRAQTVRLAFNGKPVSSAYIDSFVSSTRWSILTSDTYREWNRNINKFPFVDLYGKSIDMNIDVRVKNTKQRLSAKADTKNVYYKAAKKMIGEYSSSCSATAAEVNDRAKVNGGGLFLPLSDAKTGDFTYEPGHVAIYMGSGRTVNGSVTSHKTFWGKAPLRDAWYVEHHWYNLFRYHK
jgi:uncharacterized repeat protein (TIGR02543 family)